MSGFQQHRVTLDQLAVEWHAGEVGAHYGHGDGVAIVNGGGCLRRGQIQSGGAGLPGLVLLPALSEFGQGMVVPGRGNQGEATGQAVITKATG